MVKSSTLFKGLLLSLRHLKPLLVQFAKTILFSTLLFFSFQSGTFSQSAAFVGPASVSELAADLSGAVVNIGTSRPVAGGGGDPFPDLPPGSPLRELFEGLNPNLGQGQERMGEARSLGSGFLISENGFVVTNNHVIVGASEILVYTSQGQRYVAEVVGVDEKTDLAVLKISSGHLFPFVEFGNSDSAEVGDWVMAVGNPFGLGGSVSLGIVSARNRDFNSGPYDDYIQTDAAINLGNSGGPLFDMNGDVMGIVTALISQEGSSGGLGFAVPGNLASPIIDQLIEFGETRRGWLGVSIQEVGENLAASVGLSAAIGVLIADVTAGGPSDGNLLEGDIILVFDDAPIIDWKDLPRIVAQTAVGNASIMRVYRNGEIVEIGVTLGELEEGEKLIAQNRQDQMRDQVISQELVLEPPSEIIDDGKRLQLSNSDLLGFDVVEPSEQLLTNMGMGTNVDGLAIIFVEPESIAFEKGMRAGLIISQVDQVEIDSIEEMESLLATALENGAEAILLKIRDASGISRFVAVPLS